jgi:uncharacterized ion transporter superfamily protein YfcC
MNDLIGTGTILLALLALAGGILAARSVHRRPTKSCRRDLAVFTFSYLIWVAWATFALGWKFPAITGSFLVIVSFMYLPILVTLATRSFRRKIDGTR